MIYVHAMTKLIRQNFTDGRMLIRHSLQVLPPRLPDIIFCDFRFWDLLQGDFYYQRPASVQDLKELGTAFLHSVGLPQVSYRKHCFVIAEHSRS